MRLESNLAVVGLLMIGVVLAFTGCGEDGPMGLTGDDGPRGPKGLDYTNPVPQDRIFSLAIFNGSSAHNGAAAILLTADTSAAQGANVLIMDSLRAGPPIIDGVDDGDGVWGNYKAVIDMSERMPNSDNFIRFAEMRAAYNRDYVYFLIQWTEVENEDPPFWSGVSDELRTWTYDYDSSEWNQGTEYEDRVALSWLLSGAARDIVDWQSYGCQIACHAGRRTAMFTANDETDIDVWVWGSATSNPIGFAVDARISYQSEAEPNPNGFNFDAGARMWIDNPPLNGHPTFQHKSGPGHDGSYPMLLWEVDAFRSTLAWPDGARIPGIITSYPSYSAADLKAKGRFETGKWTVEIVRARNTRNPDDVVF